MEASIVIPAYNEEKYIGRTLESIKRLDISQRDLEVIVVDADSTDETARLAKSSGAKVIDIPHRGIGFARQQGLLQAKGEIVAYTDADTIVSSDWLKKYIDAFSKQDVVCAYGTYRVRDGSFPYYQITNDLQPTLVALAYKLGIYLPGGQNIAARRKEALQAGGFDETLALLEDADFIKMMSKVGKIAFLPDCVVYSSGRRSKEGIKYFLRAGWADFKYFVLGQKTLQKFPDFR